ncbi:MAG: hypothetical protein B7Z44_05745, partial [Caulobacter sp. 12-67-6]
MMTLATLPPVTALAALLSGVLNTAGRFALRVANDVQILDLKGREEWALSHLLAAGSRGCTPIDTPGPRQALVRR